jgi:GTP cyclohydrolase I
MIDAFLRKPMTDADRAKLKQAAQLVQEALGEDSPESLDHTPARFAALIEAALGPVDFYSPAEEMKSFPIPDTSNLLITLQGHAWSVCEHHLQPAELHARIGYIPQTVVPGYSKPVRLFKQLAHGPVLDERLCDVWCDEMERQIQPRGCIIEVMSRHHCVQSREMVRDDELLTCTSWRGCFTDPQQRLLFHLQHNDRWGR